MICQGERIGSKRVKISVVVPALNEEKNIARVIKILKACTLVDEIIVVDNNSTDSTNEIAKSLGVKTILCKKRGKGYAMEMGLKESTGSIVVFVLLILCLLKMSIWKKRKTNSQAK